jgi:hypothetical protein
MRSDFPGLCRVIDFDAPDYVYLLGWEMNGTTTYTAVRGRGRSGHQEVHVGGKLVGEIWREAVSIPKSKARNPMKWRWFARAGNDETVLGRGTRLALLIGAGFTSKNKATEALLARVVHLNRR